MNDVNIFSVFRHALPAGLLFFAAAPVHAGMIELQVADTGVSVGDEVTIDVVLTDPFDGLSGADEFLGFAFDVMIDDSLLSILSFSIADIFTDVSDQFADSSLAGVAFPGIANTADSILLASLTFFADAEGLASVSVLGLPVDAEGLFYFGSPAAGIDASVSFNIGSVAVPVPPTLALVGLGGIALFRRGRRFG